MVLCLLVSVWFQVLFHSPPGVLFTVPSRYYSLSVTWSYLALGDGPPVFRQDSSCPDVLWIPLALNQIRVRGFHPLCPAFPKQFCFSSNVQRWGPLPRTYCYIRFGLFRFRSPLLSESIFFLFLQVLRCFSSLGSPRKTMDSSYDTTALPVVSSLIRKSADHSLCATPRSLSQLVTSFFGAMYQGIRLYALCSLIFFAAFLLLRRIKNFYLKL